MEPEFVVTTEEKLFDKLGQLLKVEEEIIENGFNKLENTIETGFNKIDDRLNQIDEKINKLK